MIKVILHGCNGKMGKVLQNAIAARSDMEVVAGMDGQPSLNGDVTFPIFLVPSDCTVSGDVIIDFSHHSLTMDLLDYCVKSKTAVIIATTALRPETKNKMLDASKEIPVFHTANMSLGINLISKIMSAMVPVLEDGYNIEIVEKHHNLKIDSPSGTALLLADSINDSCKIKKDYVYGRHGTADECAITDLGIHAIRGGTIPGEHTIIFAGNDEVIEITHSALSKNIFANGALTAATFLATKESGLYSMADLV